MFAWVPSWEMPGGAGFIWGQPGHSGMWGVDGTVGFAGRLERLELNIC